MVNSVDNLSVNCIRVLSAEAIQKAKSGHPGIVLGSAPMAFELWARKMKHSPENPDWLNRDRFILSAGHGSMLLYSLLHLFGYGLSIEDIKNFRQVGSLTPGHPEDKQTVGVEASTGPLGQGFANAVGMAMAQEHCASIFNKDGYKVFDHYVFALCGDGCLMEGISSEAASLAGTLGLGKLIVLYDSNNITIEGNTDVAFTENVLDRFKAFGWQTLFVEDGNDMDAIGKAIDEAKANLAQPTIIEIKTVIGFGSPNKAGKNSSHGEPLGPDELVLTKQNLGWDAEKEFHVPDEVYSHTKKICERLESEYSEWCQMFEGYKNEYPELYNELLLWQKNEFIESTDILNDDSFWNYEGDMATRQSSEIILNKFSKLAPNLFGGSADLSPSNKSIMKDKPFYSKETPEGSNIHFGVRELAMAAMANGMCYYGMLKPYIATFFVFSDYIKPASRISAIAKLPVINILSHDSIGVGEDGPTHQPIEQLASFRSMPNFTVFRPCDTNETAAAWYYAITSKETPTALLLTRQNTKCIGIDGRNALKGGYIIKDCEGKPDVILMASGSEVGLIYDAYDILMEKGIKARIVSMPSMELFDAQSSEYKNSVLPVDVPKRIAVEASSDVSWFKYIGIEGEFIGMSSFGQSGPFAQLFPKFGFSVENVVNKAVELVNK